MCNRNNNTFNRQASSNSILNSDFFEDCVWLQNNAHSSKGVQIVELPSSSSEKSAKSADEDDKKDFGQNDNESPVYDDIVDENTPDSANESKGNSQDGQETEQYVDDFLYAGLLFCGAAAAAASSQHYYTIYDQNVTNSDSSNEYDDVELVDYESTPEWNEDRRAHDNEIYLSCAPADNEKGAVWLYSFKNKCVLSDNTFELVNIPSLDSNESIEESLQFSIEDKINVLPLIPPPYVPKLLLPTLPTVTEVKESDRQPETNASEDDSKSSPKNVVIKQNNWFLSEHATPTDTKTEQSEKYRRIVNWLALSPRENKRPLRNTSAIFLSADTSKDSNHFQTVEELSSELKKKDKSVGTKDCKDSAKESHNTFSPTENNFISKSSISLLEQRKTSLVISAKKQMKNFKSKLVSMRKSFSAPNPGIRICDYRFRKGKVREHAINDSVPKVIEPVENISGDNWMCEKCMKSDRIRPPSGAQGDGVVDVPLARKHQSSESHECLSTTEVSIPSLHLSITTEPTTESIPDYNNAWYRMWYIRVRKLLSCCK